MIDLQILDHIDLKSYNIMFTRNLVTSIGQESNPLYRYISIPRVLNNIEKEDYCEYWTRTDPWRMVCVYVYIYIEVHDFNLK